MKKDPQPHSIAMSLKRSQRLPDEELKTETKAQTT